MTIPAAVLAPITDQGVKDLARSKAEFQAWLLEMLPDMGGSILIASAIGVDLNTAGDTAMTLSAFVTGKFFVVDYVLVTNPSIVIDTAEVGIFSDVETGGLVYAVITPLALETERDWMVFVGFANTTLAAYNGGVVNGTMQNTPPIVNVSTPQGSAATADLYVYGRIDPRANRA